MFQQTVKHNIPRVPLMASGGHKEPSHLGSHCALHYHDEMEFLIVYQGEFVAIIDNKEYIAKAGEIIFINKQMLSRPTVMCGDTFVDLAKEKDLEIVAII